MRKIDFNLPERALGRFTRDRRGSVATIFAVALVPVVIAAGIGVDLTRASTSRSNLQDALDATALALAHLPSTTPQATLDSKASQWLTANLSDKAMATPQLTVTPNGDHTLSLSATSNVPTTLTAVAGFKQLPISARAQVAWGLTHVEIALVLDNTGSMAGSKIATLQQKASDLVDTLAANTDPNDPTALKIAVVPFSMTVNVGASYRGQAWLAPTLPTQYGADIFDSSTSRWDAFDALNTAWGGCVESRPQPYDVQDTPPSAGTPATLFVPFFAPDEPDSASNGYDYPNDYIPDNPNDSSSSANWLAVETDTAKYFNSWTCTKYYSNGSCKTYSQSTKNPTPRTGTNSIGYKYGPNAGCSLTSLLRLTNNTATVKAKLNQMQAVGDTNIPMGLVWGWHVLSPNGPFSDGAAYNDTSVQKIVVLLTDGDNQNTDPGNNNNNESFYSGLGHIWQNRLKGTAAGSTSAQRETAMDARQTLVCNNMKAAGITIYTVRVDVTTTVPPALSGCATTPDKFFDVPNIGSLSGAFQSIAGSIGKIRISQ